MRCSPYAMRQSLMLRVRGSWPRTGLGTCVAGRLPTFFLFVCLLLLLDASNSTAIAQQFQWANQSVGSNIAEGWGIAVDDRGNSYVTGHFTTDTTFGFGERNETVVSARGLGRSVFVAKYSREGQLRWVTPIVAASSATSSFVNNWGLGIAVDREGGCVVTGYFSNVVTLGINETNETTLTSAGGADIFVANPIDAAPSCGRTERVVNWTRSRWMLATPLPSLRLA